MVKNFREVKDIVYECSTSGDQLPNDIVKRYKKLDREKYSQVTRFERVKPFLYALPLASLCLLLPEIFSWLNIPVDNDATRLLTKTVQTLTIIGVLFWGFWMISKFMSSGSFVDHDKVTLKKDFRNKCTEFLKDLSKATNRKITLKSRRREHLYGALLLITGLGLICFQIYTFLYYTKFVPSGMIFVFLISYLCYKGADLLSKERELKLSEPIG